MIGCGRQGSRYAEAIARDVPEAGLLAVHRRSQAEAEKTAAEYGAGHGFSDYRSLLSLPGLDAVVIATPNSSHLEIALEAAEAGKHMLVEKPLARSVEEAGLIVSAARRQGVKLMVGHSFRYHPMTTIPLELLPSIGDVYLCAMSKRQQPAPGWRLDPEERGGVVMDLGVHLFDLAAFTLGKRVKGVYCVAHSISQTPVEDLFTAALELDGAAALLDANTVSSCRVDKMEFSGREGHIISDRYGREVLLVNRDGRRKIAMEGPDHTLHLLVRDFVKAIIEDGEPTITGEDGLEAVRVAEACYRSSETGRRVPVG